jgi:hypothetical protein
MSTKGKSVASTSKSVSVTSSKAAGKTGDKGKSGEKGGKPRLVVMTADGEVDLTPLGYLTRLARSSIEISACMLCCV